MPVFDPVTAVLRAFEVLRLINQLEHASIAEIHRNTGYPKATVLRMVETLMSAGYVARVDGTTTYSPTGKCLLLGSGLRTHARMTAKATPILNTFRRKIGWPSDFGLFDDDAMVIAATSREFGVLSLNRKPGARAPLLLSALGRAYLAFCPEEKRRQILERLRQSSNNLDAAASNYTATARMLNQTRARGYSLTDNAYLETTYEGAIWGIGVPILAGGLVVASMNVMFLRSALSLKAGIASLLPPLRQAAKEIGAELAQEAPAPSGVAETNPRRRPVKARLAH
jgi:IclR family transcriptional regulator, mhp operon transcriptional activator